MKKKSDLEKSGSVPLMKMSHNPSHTKKSFLSTRENLEPSFDITHVSFLTESWSPKMPAFEYLDLSLFKVFPCNNMNPHNYKTCCYYHNIKDKRRGDRIYSSDLCEYIEKNIECPKSEACEKSHNYIEVLYHPDKYKKKFCSFFPNNVHNCEYLHYCSFAHSEQEILIDLIHNYDFDDDFYMFHYKTIWCPFNLSQHNKALCVYAHNWQDFRRRPDKHLYEFIPCEKWKNNDIILNYEAGCPKGFECNKSHGWKESEFHPLNYKTRPCSISKPCSKGKDCPFYHTSSEKRVIPPLFDTKFFCFVPRNRVIKNTFKIRAGSSARESVLSSYSIAPFFLNPVQETDEPQQEMTHSTKLTPSISDISWNPSLFRKENDKELRKPMEKRRLSDPTQPFMQFGMKYDGENPKLVRFKTITENQNSNKYDQSESLEKDIMKILISDESDEDNEGNEKK